MEFFWRENVRQMASDPVILNKPFLDNCCQSFFAEERLVKSSPIYIFLMGGFAKQRLPKLLACLNILKNKCLESQTFDRDPQY